MEIRRRVLSKLESKPLQKLAEDCQRVVSVKNDSRNIEESGVAYVRRTNYKLKNYAPGKSSENKRVRQDTIVDPSKNRNYPQVHAIVAVDNIGQQIVSTRTKLITSVVKMATKQHAVGTKEIKKQSDKQDLILK